MVVKSNVKVKGTFLMDAGRDAREQIELIRPVFEKIAEGFERYSYGDYKAEGLMDNLIEPVDMDVL